MSGIVDAGVGGDDAAADGSLRQSLIVVGQEIRRSSVNAVAVDVLYVFTVAFFASLAVRGLWPAAIAALPIAIMLYFAWNSSRLFLLTNLIAISLAVGATRTGFMPL